MNSNVCGIQYLHRSFTVWLKCKPCGQLVNIRMRSNASQRFSRITQCELLSSTTVTHPWCTSHVIEWHGHVRSWFNWRNLPKQYPKDCDSLTPIVKRCKLTQRPNFNFQPWFSLRIIITNSRYWTNDPVSHFQPANKYYVSCKRVSSRVQPKSFSITNEEPTQRWFLCERPISH